MEPLQEDADVLGDKGGPPPDPMPTQDRSALALGKNKANMAGERPQFMELGRLGSSRFSPYEARRLRSWNREKVMELGSDDEDLIHTSNYLAALENESSCSGQLMNQDG